MYPSPGQQTMVDFAMKVNQDQPLSHTNSCSKKHKLCIYLYVIDTHYSYIRGQNMAIYVIPRNKLILKTYSKVCLKGEVMLTTVSMTK